ncbi:MAG: UvrD-helicase domain-containing protein [Elusimicrobiota bacterium]|jgi:DNA helicase-2/ATP-dependent DNA helicase PcrA|nr:UvrD-helicase domain-containing protein [Elusimicrobiota bacterium]
MLDFEKLLNKSQLEAVLQTDGPVLVLSAAGSGKTRVITYRIANLIQKGIHPYNILAVTFTNKAAREMKERIFKIIGSNANGILISTFHSMCAQFLRDEAENIGLNKNFSICDSQDQKNIVKQCLNKLNLDDKKFIPNVISSLIGRAKDDMISASEYRSNAEKRGEFFFITVGEIYEIYQKTLEESQNLDFGDLQFKVVEMLENNPKILAKFQERFKYIMVDEFQDTNYCQYLMIKLLSGKYKNICVVGDDDQSIYSWRGANVENILNFENDFANTKSIKLEQNYRSTKNILKAADKLVKNNIERKNKTIWTENEVGEEIVYIQTQSEKYEAEFIAKEIQKLANEGYSLNEIAIFYRTNAQSRIFEEVFRNLGVPYILVGSIKFYDRKEIKDVLSYLKVIINPNDTINLKRIINLPARGISDKSIDLVESLQKDGDSFFDILTNIVMGAYTEEKVPNRLVKSIQKFHSMIIELMKNANKMTLREIINTVLEKTGYMQSLYEDNTIYKDSRIENVMELVSAAGDFEETFGDVSLEGFLEHTVLINDIDKLNNETQKVTLMTLHLAKGLEFPIVFLTGMEEGLFPNSKVDYDKNELEEERRLCFVGITRAMKKLYCLAAMQRKIYGMTKMHLPSRFLKEAGILDDIIDKQNNYINPYAKFDDYINKYDKQNNNNHYRYYEKGEKFNENKVFKKGERVKHPSFGIGTILDFYGRDDNKTVYIKFYNGIEKRLILKYAKLEKYISYLE